jgi:quercetin dioxygenase-like cupin family protein
MKRLVLKILILAIAYILVGVLVDRVILPEAEPGPDYYPQQGYVFVSKTEGFRQKILKREGGLAWIELELAPRAPGPPEHIHTSFAENFIVTEGTLSLLVNGEKKLVRAGESLVVTPGTPHKPFNETDSRVVISPPLTPEYALPERFTVFLTQAYAFFDESESHGRPPKALLQMSRFSPKYDVWLAGPPVPLQKALFFIIGPTARVFGYRTRYEKYMPNR